MKIKRKIYSLLLAMTLFASVIPMAAVNAAEDTGVIDETYDSILAENTCEEAAENTELCEGAPDGTNYLKTSAETELCTAEAANGAYYMWEADVRFDEAGSGFTIMSKTDKDKVGTCVRRYDGKSGTDAPKLAIQTASTSYAAYTEIDTEAWYHIQLSGQYGGSGTVSMNVSKWENGELKFIGEYDKVSQRNNPLNVCYIKAEKGTSIDNLRITKLGADTLTLKTIPENVTEVYAGASLSFSLGAERQSRYITVPEVEWKVYENNEEIADGSVTITDGIMSVSKDCGTKTVTVKAISTEKGNAEGEYEVSVKKADWDSLKFDEITLSADRAYVKASAPLTLNVSAKKDGNDVVLDDGDVSFYVYDKTKTQKIGNVKIKAENNTLYVDDTVISQEICVVAGDENELVTSSLPVIVKADDATDIGDSGDKEPILFADAGEDVANPYIASGAPDGSHYYNYTGSTTAATVEATDEDVVMEFDIKFVGEAQININTGGKVGGELARVGTNIVKYTGSKPTTICECDADSWYHIEYFVRCGGDTTNYAFVNIYKYDSEGQLVHPVTGALGLPLNAELGLRTVNSSNLKFNRLNVNDGIAMDNLRILKMHSDSVKVALSTSAIFGGNKAQASYTVLRKDMELTHFPSGKIEWSLLDENQNALEDKTVSIDDTGLVTTTSDTAEQTIYVKATATDSGAYAIAPLTIKGSDIFTVKGIGVSKDSTKVEELKVQKSFFYNGDVTFIIAIYDTDGRLTDIETKTVHNNTYAIGENKISFDIALPESFGNVKAMIWTSLNN